MSDFEEDEKGEEQVTKVLENKIIRMLRECGDHPPLYEDVDFIPTPQSLYKNVHELPEYTTAMQAQSESPTDPLEVAWSRPTAYATDPDYFKSTSGCGTIREGILDDAWLLGVFAAIACHPDGLIENLLVSEVDDFKKYGIYTCRFFKEGEWVEVVTDTRVPYSHAIEAGDVPPAEAHAIYGSSENKEECWIPLLEKAYAKLHGSYEALHKGSTLEAFIDCTGGSVKFYNFADKAVRSLLGTQPSEDELWKEFVQQLKSKSIISCQLQQQKVMQGSELSTNGVLKNHLYTVLFFKVVGSLRFVKIKNPWGRGTWRGDWGNDDIKWDDNHQVEASLRMDPLCEFSRSGSDGTFWMIWEDFLETFNEAYITVIFPDTCYQYAVRGEWIDETAAGAPTTIAREEDHSHAEEKNASKWMIKKDGEPSWFRNPQYRIVVASKTSALISLLQRDSKLHGGENHAINFVVMEGKKSDRSIVWEYKPSKVIAEAHSVYEDTSSLLREVSRGDVVFSPEKAYTIIPYTDGAGIEMEFFLRIVSSKRIKVEAMPAIHTKVLKGEWKAVDELCTAGGPLRANFFDGPINNTWCQNPQYWINICNTKADTISMKLVLKSNQAKHTPLTKSKVKAPPQEKAKMLGLLLVKPDTNLYTKSKYQQQKEQKEQKEQASPKKSSQLVGPKSEDNFVPERKLVISKDEWCCTSDYSRTTTACVFMPKVIKDWAPQGILVVPTLGEPNVEGTFELEIYSDKDVQTYELPSQLCKVIQGEWSVRSGTACGCHLNTDWKKNPKFFLYLKSPRPTKVKITLSRSESEWEAKCKRDVVGTMMGFYVFQGQKLNRVGSSVQFEGRNWSETDFVPMHQLSSPDELMFAPSFNEPYVIVPSTWEQGISGKFLVSITAECDFVIAREPIS